MDGELQALADFLRRHWDMYSVEALRKQLIAEGHDERLVGTAIARVSSEREARRREEDTTIRDARGSAIVANVLLVVIVSVWGFLAGLGNLPNPWWLLIFAPLLELAIGSWLQRHGSERIGMALIVTATYSLVPMSIWAVLVGLCVQGVQG